MIESRDEKEELTDPAVLLGLADSDSDPESMYNGDILTHAPAADWLTCRLVACGSTRLSPVLDHECSTGSRIHSYAIIGISGQRSAGHRAGNAGTCCYWLTSDVLLGDCVALTEALSRFIWWLMSSAGLATDDATWCCGSLSLSVSLYFKLTRCLAKLEGVGVLLSRAAC